MAPQGWADGSQTWPNRFHQSRNEEALYDFCTELLQNRSVSDTTYAARSRSSASALSSTPSA